MSGDQAEWRVFVENREEVIRSLERGECDGILPAARGFLDGFAGFLSEAGVLAVMAEFPDLRERRSVPIFFFCNTLIYKPLFQLPRLAPIERTLFRSPYILWQMGFNALQINKGFYQVPGAQRPFTVEAIQECFARVRVEDFIEHQKAVLQKLVSYCPGEFLRGLWAMDSVHITVPRGAHTGAFSFKACVLGVWQDEVIWPLLWAFVPEDESELDVGKEVIGAAEDALGEGAIQHLLLDRGYLDGEWISDLYEHGTRVTIKVKEDMRVLEELQLLSRLPDTIWTEVEPPKFHQEPFPQRTITGFADLQGEWSNCRVPLSGCLIKDVYPDHITFQGVVTTAKAAEAMDIYRDNQRRWFLEEVYMVLTRYWQFDDLAPCRPGVAYALVHFAMLAFTLLGFYFQEIDGEITSESLLSGPPPVPMPERELAVYAGDYFTLLLASELVQIILTHTDAWQANQDKVLIALRLCEGDT